MSDAGEKDWNDSGRPKGPPGVTKGASLMSGLAAHEQITSSFDSLGMGHGQGQRPSKNPRSKISRGGKTFTTR